MEGKKTFITVLFLGFYIIGWGCNIMSGTYNQAQLQNYINNNGSGTTSIVIPNGEIVTISGNGWDLASLNIDKLTIKGAASLIFGNNKEIIFSSTGQLIIEDINNGNALAFSNNTNPNKCFIQIGSNVYWGNTFASIISNGGTGSTLSVELGTFSANVNNSNVLLEWNTLSEEDNEGFEIQRKEGNEWLTISTIEGAGTSLVPTYYSFIDYRPKNGVNYYRLKIIDYDGTIEYSNVTTAIVTTSAEIKIQSRAITNLLRIEVPNNQKATVKIISMNGQQVVEQTFFDNKMLDLSHLITGTYAVCVQTKDAYKVEKIMVTK